MHYIRLDLRRFFRNRFEAYVDRGDTNSSGVSDGVPLSFREVCEMLADDKELFPRRYDQDLRRLCGDEFSIWIQSKRSYGDVACSMRYVLDFHPTGLRRPSGLWVSDVLRRRNALEHRPLTN